MERPYWLHCCGCRVGLLCERGVPPWRVERVEVNAVAELEAQTAVLEDQVRILNTIFRDQIIAHKRRQADVAL